MSLKAHIPTGFIYVAKMTHIFVPGSMSRVYIPVGLNAAELGRNYPNVLNSAEFD